MRHPLPDKIVRSAAAGGRADRGAPRTCASTTTDAWTVTEKVRFSRAPVWQDGTMMARPAMVRVCDRRTGRALAHCRARALAKADELSVSMQRGGSSLDTWVLTDGPVDSFSMLPTRLSVDDIAARRPPVSSRTAENLFWFGRYTERTEQMVRLARALLMLIDTDEDAPETLREVLSDLAVRFGPAPWGVPTPHRSPPLFERALMDAIADPRGGSIAFNLGALERAAQALRERLSNEQWNVVRSMGSHIAALRAANGLPTPGQVLPALDRLGVQLAAVTGAQTDRMTRDHGWRFMTVGRLLERLIGMSTQLDSFVDSGALQQASGMEMLLELFDSAITFRARYQRHEDLLALTDLLVLDSANPRSLAGVLRRLRTELGKLPGGGEFIGALLARLPASGAGLDLEALRGADETQLLHLLKQLCEQLGASGTALSDDLGHRFFAHAATGDELQHV